MHETALKNPIGAAQWLRLYRLYRKAFPVYERKPFSMIRRMYRAGKADVWYCEKGKEFIGLVTTVNGEDNILVDYLAVSEKHRGSGLGSEILQLIREKYSGKGVFLEIESVYEECDDKENRIKRKNFYIRNGMEPMNVMVLLFGVKMELLGFDCLLSFEQYKAFYHDNLSPWAAEHVEKLDHPETEGSIKDENVV